MKKTVVLLYEQGLRAEFDQTQSELFNKIQYMNNHKDSEEYAHKKFIEAYCSPEKLYELVQKIREIESKSVVGSIHLSI